MKTNILSLSFRKVDCPKSPSYLVGELRIDGQLLGDRYVLDVRRLAQALQREGEHFIFTCGCGVPGCAGIVDGVQSRISGDQVTLAGSLPKGGAFSFVLSAAQARKAVADALLAEKDFLDEACRWEEGEFPVFGFSAYSYRGFIDEVSAW